MRIAGWQCSVPFVRRRPSREGWVWALGRAEGRSLESSSRRGNGDLGWRMLGRGPERSAHRGAMRAPSRALGPPRRSVRRLLASLSRLSTSGLDAAVKVHFELALQLPSSSLSDLLPSLPSPSSTTAFFEPLDPFYSARLTLSAGDSSLLSPATLCALDAAASDVVARCDDALEPLLRLGFALHRRLPGLYLPLRMSDVVFNSSL